MSYDHTAARAAYQDGQRWEYLKPWSIEWKPCVTCENPARPCAPEWNPKTRYRVVVAPVMGDDALDAARWRALVDAVNDIDHPAILQVDPKTNGASIRVSIGAAQRYYWGHTLDEAADQIIKGASHEHPR